jgi:hypothetical protein
MTVNSLELDVNNDIRTLAGRVRETIIKMDDSMFTILSVEILRIAPFASIDLKEKLHDLIRDTSYSLGKGMYSRESIGNRFYNEAISMCREFLN